MREINDDIIVSSYNVIRTKITVFSFQKMIFERNIGTCSIAFICYPSTPLQVQHRLI